MKQTAWAARLDDGQHEGLQEIADACRVEKITALRWAADALIDYWKKHGGRVLLPLNFDETFEVRSLSQAKAMILQEPPRAKVPAKSK